MRAIHNFVDRPESVADCADYETYRSGKFIPGIMGTLFSLVDKLVPSLAATVVSLAVGFIGYNGLPTKTTPYMEGMNWVVIDLFCIVPMVAWAATLIAMRGYELDGKWSVADGALTLEMDYGYTVAENAEGGLDITVNYGQMGEKTYTMTAEQAKTVLG